MSEMNIFKFDYLWSLSIFLVNYCFFTSSTLYLWSMKPLTNVNLEYIITKGKEERKEEGRTEIYIFEIVKIRTESVLLVLITH